jgi:hypothetical protein
MAFSGVRVFADVVLECEMLAPVRGHPLYGFCTDPAGGERTPATAYGQEE